MPVKKNPARGNGSTLVLKRPASCPDVVRKALSKMPEIDAVFLLADDANVMHVFSVVKEFHAKIYDKLLKKERAIEQDLPGIAFEFHVRAHQGRQPSRAVPFEAKLVYER